MQDRKRRYTHMHMDPGHDRETAGPSRSRSTTMLPYTPAGATAPTPGSSYATPIDLTSSSSSLPARRPRESRTESRRASQMQIQALAQPRVWSDRGDSATRQRLERTDSMNRPRMEQTDSTTQPIPDVDNYMEYFVPQWQPDAEATACPICNTPFSFWYRKHHCRKCGRVVCASCSPHRITIPRQFIVRPPAEPRTGQAMPGVVQYAHGATQGRGQGQTSGAVQSPSAINPALGGGEEVRLCNPCVPDPNPDPPRGYMMPPRHRSYHSLSSPRQFGFVCISLSS